MEAVVKAPDAAGAMRALLDRLGPQAVLLSTRRIADGVEMTGASSPPPPNRGAIERFRHQAGLLGFDRRLVDAATDAVGPTATAANLWVRFVAGIERRVTVIPPPHRSPHPIGVIGSPDARLGLLEGLVRALAPDRPVLVAAAAPGPVEALGRRHKVQVVRPDLRWGLDRLRPAHARLLIDLGDPAVPVPAIEADAQSQGLVRLGAIGDAPPDAALADRSDALAFVGDPGRPGLGISQLLLHDRPLAYVVASPDDPLAPARASKLCQRIVTALARLGPEAG